MTGGPGHLSPEILADSAEGLLPAAEDAAVRAHLSSCAACRQVAADLRDVSVLLAADVAPRMPAQVAARLEDTLSAETPLTAAPSRQHATVPAGPPRQRSRRRMPVWIGAAAAAVLGVTGAVLGVRALDDGETETSSTVGAALEADRAAEAPAPAPAPGGEREYTAATLDAQVATLLATGDDAAAQEDAAGDGREAAPGSSPGSAGGTAEEPAPPTADLSALANLATPEGLAACVTSLTGRGGVTPIAVDLASFEKRPAAIIVLPDPTDAEMLDVRVVGAGCSATDDDLIFATRVPRP